MVTDVLGTLIQVGDRIVYPSYHRDRHQVGTVLYVSESAIEIELDDPPPRDVFRSPEVCMVLDSNNPRVTTELLKVEIVC